MDPVYVPLCCCLFSAESNLIHETGKESKGKILKNTGAYRKFKIIYILQALKGKMDLDLYSSCYYVLFTLSMFFL